MSKGNYTKLKPDKNDLIDIKRGIKSLNNSNSYDHIQAAIVRNDRVIAQESSKGTKKMIQSIKKIKNKSGILIKFPKKKQDLRADLPTIGLDTFVDCKKVGLKGVVLKNKQNIFLEKKLCIKFANKNKMFVTVR